MPNPRMSPTSYWLDTTESTAHPSLDADLDVDVAVVGGGIAGLCTAWELARAGRSVVVLEADRIAAGVTGFTTAKLTALHGLIYSKLRSSHGAEAARLYASSQQDAMEHVADVCAELGIDAELERVPAYTYAESTDRLDDLREEAEAAREAGLHASFVEATGLPFEVAGAVCVEAQLQFHPRKFLLGLAADFLARGGRIHERSRVVNLHDGARCRLTTESGAEVTARDVVVATHSPVFDRAMLFTRLKPRRELVVAAPVPAEAVPMGMYITPEQHTRSVRTAPYENGQRLLIITGESSEPGSDDVGERFERLEAWAGERFPAFAAAGEATRYRWATQDNDSSDHVPYVGHAYPGTSHVYVASGFGGWGMSNGVMAGRLITAHVLGGERPQWTDLYDPRRLPPLKDAPTLLAFQSAVAKHFVGDRLHTSHVDSVDEIPPGSGAVVRLAGRRCAVYRDESGAARAVSARCTHLGCLVRFNDAERAWECPCHGSRFAVDGSVLHGPATRPLEPREVPGAEE
ncbi:FAD-dependent oxidoreductase [Streptomyces sp. URMC 123]|uniref:FAD-dependent oxidoreductase n=1 Tax=Streptomyces sp. URMC 123 TaxID=3423403 RepID=UPI003F1A0089